MATKFGTPWTGYKEYDYTKDDPYSPFYETPRSAAEQTQIGTKKISDIQAQTTPPWDVDFGDIGPYGGEKELGVGEVRRNSQTRRGASGFTVAQQRPTGQTTTTTMAITKPTMPLPKYDLPERDPERVKELRAQELSYPMRKYRQEARRMLPRISGMEGPMRGEAMRKWTEGLGTGISGISKEAGLGAERLYATERGEEIRAGERNFLAELQDYLSQYGQTQKAETKYQYGPTGASGMFGGEGEYEYFMQPTYAGAHQVRRRIFG